jgi:adenylate cyclase
MYLTADEYEQLSRMPGADLQKARHAFLQDGLRFSIDVFQGRHTGLALAEIELPGQADVAPPTFAGEDVTCDERFTGAWLAFATAGTLAAILSSTCGTCLDRPSTKAM